MNREFKILLLILILFIPAGIYIFLQAFGRNEFSLPVYEAKDTMQPSNSIGEGMEYTGNMVFPELYNAEGHPINQKILDGNILILELVSDENDVSKQDYQINRVADIFRKEKSVRLLRVFNKEAVTQIPDDSKSNYRQNNISVCYAESEEIKALSGFQTTDNGNNDKRGLYSPVLLIDSHRRIRGYYNKNDFEEIDRLVLEVKILLNQKSNV